MSIVFSNVEKKMIGTKHTRSGYTLVEMAIALLIIGFFLAGAIQIYAQYRNSQITEKTQTSISRAATAIFEFKNANGRFPCPSPIKEGRNSPNYGHETDCSDPNIGTASVVNPGECLNGTIGPNNYDGICIEASNRSISGVNPRVRMGAIPFRELQIDEEDTMDGYGSRLVYVVTEDMAVASTFKDSRAGIELRDGNGTVLSGGDQSVAFMVISPGPNMNGAVSREGTVKACDNAANMLDAENCRDFTTTTNTQAVYAMDLTSSGTNQFDDVVEYFVPSEAEMWRRQTPTSENIVDLSEKNVGVGTITPTETSQALSIKQSTVNNTTSITDTRNLAATNTLGGNNQSGALRVGKYSGGAHSGKVLANNYCTKNGTLCFSTERITAAYDGNPTTGTQGMGCPSGQYMIGIGSGRAICAPIRIFCSSGQAITGFDGNGAPICTTPLASCAPDTKSLCGTSYALVAGGNGSTRTLNYNTGGACAYSVYYCNSGTWMYWYGYDTAYACTFTSGAPATRSLPGQTCASGYSGTYTQNQTQDCYGNWYNTTNTSAADCTCVGKTDPSYCPSSFGGAVGGTKKRVCTGGVLDTAYTVFTGNDTISYGSESAMLAANCICGKTDGWEFVSCGSGQVRKASPSPSSFSSPAASWPGAADQGAYRKRNTDTSTCSYSYVPGSGYNTSNCECATGYNWVAVNPTCAACTQIQTQGSKRQIRSGSSCGWIDDPDTSANTTGTCSPITYIWKSSGVVAGPPNALALGHGTSPVCTSSCTCGENGTTGTCAIATSTEWTYYRSTCQPQ